MKGNGIGKTIGDLRKSRGMTQEELGSRLGVSSQAVSKWELGGWPDIELLPSIADVFDCTVDHLFGREPHERTIDESDLFDLVFGFFRNITHSAEYNLPPQKIGKELFFPLIMELCWTAQLGYWGQERMPLARAYELNVDNEQVSSQIVNDHGLSYLSMREDFPVYFVVPDNGGISKKILNETRFCDLFSLFGDRDSFKLILFSQEHMSNGEFTKEGLSRRFNIEQERLTRILPKLVEYGFLSEREVTMDEKSMITYHPQANPHILPILMIAHEYIHKRQCFFNFIYERKKPYIEG